jgi:rod shape-determining protein MreC
MVGFKHSQDNHYSLLASHVIGRDPSTWNSEITIDEGRADGVTENMPVVSGDGSLVGRVSAAADYSSKVILVTDTQVGDGVSAKVLTGTTQQPFGIVVGSSSAPGKLQMNFLSPLANLSVGDSVVTSHLGGIFPDGLVIGRVSKVTNGEQGLTQMAIIQPAADLAYVQDVFVVKGTKSS